MSASVSRQPPQTIDITCITPEPFEPIPLIADILRTGYCVPGSVFLVEGVDAVHTSRSKRWRAVRLLLGDGELCIQALLSAEMHRYVDSEEVAFGSYVKLERFRVEWKDIANGVGGKPPAATKGKGKDYDHRDNKNKMVYLVVEDLVLVGWNNTLVDTTNTRDAQVDINQSSQDEAVSDTELEPEPEMVPVPTTEPLLKDRPVQSFDSGAGPLKEIAEADDDFEVTPIAPERATQNRLDLVARTSNNAPTSSNISTARTAQTSHFPSSSLGPPKAVKLTKLRAIPNLPYKQNWSVNVLAVVSALSAVEPSALPPHTQRQVRLADPSTDKHVLLTVFLDPEQFAPAVGSVVLLLGVKNHRFDGGSLKKYASDRARAPGHTSWWYENPTQFDWCDVQGLRRWWESWAS
ncbi:hypothetical protein AAE478_005290 [Parahypoxylon ruwenzoriense]